MTKILIVEDNPMNLDMLTRRLVRAGYQVVSAEDGLRALEVAKREQPALILMDLSLPYIDGWEATRRIRADAETTRIPVIALTAHALTSDREHAMAAGCTDFDTKPVEMPRLLSKIKALLSVAASQDAPS
jgi:two-component system cell cycle response regulator DivK